MCLSMLMEEAGTDNKDDALTTLLKIMWYVNSEM